MTRTSPWFNTAEAAEYAKTSVETIIQARERGDLLGYQRIYRGTWRFHEDDLDRWVRGEPAASPQSSGSDSESAA
jgi:excisionase family DNA binding protein